MSSRDLQGDPRGDSPASPLLADEGPAGPLLPHHPQPATSTPPSTAAAAGSAIGGGPTPVSAAEEPNARTRAIVPRPGISFHKRVLSSFLSGVSFCAAAPNTAPPWQALGGGALPGGTAEGVAGLLSYFFCDPSETLVVAPVAYLLFSIVVASPAVAQFVAAVGPGLMTAVNLSRHVSQRGARAPARRATARAARLAFKSHQPGVNAPGRRRPTPSLMAIWRPVPSVRNDVGLLPLPTVDVSPRESSGSTLGQISPRAS